MGRRGLRDGTRAPEIVGVCGAPRLRGRGVKELQDHGKASSQLTGLPRQEGLGWALTCLNVEAETF
jgi:hypothetical protein